MTKKTEEVMAQAFEAASKRLASSITFGMGEAGARDASGGYVASLTEAVMGMTAALVEIGGALHDIAEAIRHTDIAEAIRESKPIAGATDREDD